jgi:menaquinone-specific isochorismate synthase
VAERSLRDLFEAAQTEDDVGLPGCGPVAFGSFTFDAARAGSVLILPPKVLGRRAGTAWMTSITPVGRGSRFPRAALGGPAGKAPQP